MSTFVQLRAMAANRYRDTANAIIAATTTSLPNWTDYINGRYRRVSASNGYWPFLAQRSTSVTIASETRSTTLPTNAFRVANVYDSTDKIKLEPLEGTAEMLRFWPDGTEDGTPVNYRVRNNTLEVYPLPTQSTTFTVEYFAPPSDLSADSDVPVFPAQYHDMLVEGALADAYLDDGNLKQYAAHEAVFQAILKEMEGTLLDTQTERYYEVTDNFF